MQNTGLEKNKFNVVSFEYDFSKDGGAIGAITLDNDILPDDAVIVGGGIEVKTAFVGATATIAFGVNTTTDVLGATAVATFSAGALIDAIQDMAMSNGIKTAAKKNLTMTIAVAALTAGRAVVYLYYVLGV